MSKARLRNVDEEGIYTQKGLDREPDPAARYLFRAQHRVRVLEGAGPDDPLLPYGPRDVAEALRWTRNDLHLPGIDAMPRPGDNDWRPRMRVNVRPL